jgi:hypothetical protein
MIKRPDKIWIYWFITDLLLIADVLLWAEGLSLAVALTCLQIIHFSIEQKSITSFASQVRMAYVLLLALAFWPPLYWLIYPVIVGTTAMVLFNYCFLARFMSLMPWNHQQTFSFNLIWQTFISKPVKGSVQKIPQTQGDLS